MHKINIRTSGVQFEQEPEPEFIGWLDVARILCGAALMFSVGLGLLAWSWVLA